MLSFKKTRGSENPNIIHFVGIGGIGMSGIAEVMHNLGYKVQGSDIAHNNNTKRLQASGLTIFHNHSLENIHNVSYIVISSAIQYDDPEIQAALLKKIPIIKRAEMLAELMRFKYSIAVSGAHGKTTTTSLIACLFEAAGLQPTVINGGIINNKSTNAYVGTGDYLIAEADESDATFVNIPSTVAVITNIAAEHMDFYQNFETLIQTFRKFITSLPFYGFGVACVDHPIVRDLVSTITERKVITYGIDSSDAHIRAINISCDISSSTFDVIINLPNFNGSTIIEKITIPVPGKHNILNSLAAIAIGSELDFGIKAIKNGFRNFNGVKRRFTKIMEYNGASIIDDYAHHPDEIEATLATARLIANQQAGRVIAIFQPHRYSRLKYLFEDFSECFNNADKLYITDVYSAGEEMIENISGLSLVNNIKNSKHHQDVEFIDSHEKIAAIVQTTALAGDLIVMMGAGSISVWANNLPTQLANS